MICPLLDLISLIYYRYLQQSLDIPILSTNVKQIKTIGKLQYGEPHHKFLRTLNFSASTREELALAYDREALELTSSLRALPQAW